MRTMSLPHSADLSRAATEARGLAMDAVAACHSGHLGLPLGAAEIGSVLYGNFLRHDPAAPSWINRDRFVLSAGHGSMFIYGWLHLAGFDLPLQERSPATPKTTRSTKARIRTTTKKGLIG